MNLQKIKFSIFNFLQQKRILFSLTNLILNDFYICPSQFQIYIYIYGLIALFYLPLTLFFISRMSQKYIKLTNFSLKIGSHFSSLIDLFFLQINIKKKLYSNVPEMSNFNPKTSIQKYPIFCSWYNVFHC